MNIFDFTILLAFRVRSELNRLRSGFEDLGFKKVLAADSLESAWDLLKAHSCDLVVAEREISSTEDMALLKKMMSHPNLFLIPFIMVTEENRKNKIIEAICEGVSGYVLKPYTLSTMENKAVQLLKARLSFAAKMKRIEKGHRLLNEGKLDEAIESFQQAVGEPLKAEDYYDEGYRYMAAGRFDEAIGAFRKAIEINHMYAEAYRGLGEAYIKKGDINEAEKYLLKSGKLFIERTQFDEARKAILMALQVNPGSTNPYNTLGILYRKSGDLRKAIHNYQMALQLNPFDPFVHYNLARAFFESKQPQEAMEALDKALKLNPDFGDARRLKRHLALTGTTLKPEEPTVLLSRYLPVKEERRGPGALILAADQELKRKVRVIRYAVLPDDFPDADFGMIDEAWEMLERVGRLKFPCLVSTIETCRENNAFYVVQDTGDDENLSEFLKSGRELPFRLCLEIGIRVAGALDQVHNEGVLHLSLDPSHIFLSRELTVKLDGFGLYRFETAIRPPSMTMDRGAGPYFTPEHFSGEPFSPATDVFSLAVILHELLSGEHPFQGPSSSSMMYNICFKDPTPYRHPNEAFAESMGRVFGRALAKKPTERFETAALLQEALLLAMTECLREKK